MQEIKQGNIILFCRSLYTEGEVSDFEKAQPSQVHHRIMRIK